MLFFYGTGTSCLLSAPLPATACTHCGSTGQLSATVFSRYASLFWTPIFPFTKTSVTVCGHCQQTIAKLKQMPESYRPPVQQLQQQARYPVSNFAVLILFGLTLAFIFGVGWFSDPKPATALAGEKAAVQLVEDDAGVQLSDRYRADAGKAYMLAEVTSLTADTVYYKITTGLMGELTPASATIALRDSVLPGGDKGVYPRSMWHYMVKGNAMFKPI
ncbi:hypothetical protein [Hymenobacter psychrophilus]|uniref:Zinc-ribbon 15 domain-containing protein n=1 Tax=Hymenobacter psychrophilus TaxID=651662 RepID=A0A1H3BWB5_9BACT|nr:hypothetical protein [Hymenobacter psychrophilus]SDX46081.1 hypothetical protein SAMN04488069_101445 [Hymenobacter psychrophilus]